MRELHPLRGDLCPGCGGESDTALALCSACMEMPPRPWRSAVAAFEYSGFAAELILKMKFSDRPDLARPFGLALTDILTARGVKADFIVPVPLHWQRMISRGYNQSALLAEMLSRGLDIPVLSGLRRIGFAGHQARLGMEQRLKAQRGSFICTAADKISGRTVLLVDDVITTGSTLTAAAEELLKSGCGEVHIAVAARTPRG